MMITTDLIKKLMPPDLLEQLTIKYHYKGQNNPAFSILEWQEGKDEKHLVFSHEANNSGDLLKFISTLRIQNPNLPSVRALDWLSVRSKQISLLFNYEPGDMIFVRQAPTMRGILIQDLSAASDRWLISSTAQFKDPSRVDTPSAIHSCIPFITPLLPPQPKTMAVDDICALLSCAQRIPYGTGASRSK
jgi:hypothetical protein